MWLYWLSSFKMTVSADVDEKGIITRTAPITRKFEGQHISNLIGWMKKQGGFKMDFKLIE